MFKSKTSRSQERNLFISTEYWLYAFGQFEENPSFQLVWPVFPLVKPLQRNVCVASNVVRGSQFLLCIAYKACIVELTARVQVDIITGYGLAAETGVSAQSFGPAFSCVND